MSLGLMNSKLTDAGFDNPQFRSEMQDSGFRVMSLGLMNFKCDWRECLGVWIQGLAVGFDSDYLCLGFRV